MRIRMAICFTSFVMFGLCSAQNSENSKSFSTVLLHGGLQSAMLRNTSISGFINEYNSANNVNVPYPGLLAGYEAGMTWSLLHLSFGSHRRGTSAEIGEGMQRHFRLENNYFNVFGMIPVRRLRSELGLGVMAYASRFVAFLKYPNGEVSRGLESNLNGTYKALALNASARLQRNFILENGNRFSLFVTYTGPFTGTSFTYSDFNGAKSALVIGSTSITSLEIQNKFSGFIIGFNYHKKIQF